MRAAYIGWYNSLLAYGSELELIDELAYRVTGSVWRLGGSREQAEIANIKRKLGEGAPRDSVVEEIYDFANRGFLYRLPLPKLREIVTEHGRKLAKRLNKPILDTLVKGRMDRDGLALVVIGPTPASEAEVREVLNQTGYNPETFKILANPVEKTVDGKLSKLTININGPDRRKYWMAGFMRMNDYVKPEETAFVAGGEDDKECVRHVVVSGGRPIVSPLAAEPVRARLVKLYGRLVRTPKDAEELERALLE